MLRLSQTAFALAMVAFLLGPILAILPLAFTSGVFLTYPVPSFSLRWFAELADSAMWSRSIINSLVIGTAATLLSVILGTLAAMGLRGNVLPLGVLMRAVFLLPMVVPAVVLGVGLQMFMGRIGLASSYLGVIIAHAMMCTPFVIISVSAALNGVNPSLERAAASMGAGTFTVFRRVTAPLAMPGIATGAVFAFATSLDEVVLTLFVAGPEQRTLARQMFSSIRENISPAVAAAAVLLITGTLLLLALVAVLRRRRG